MSRGDWRWYDAAGCGLIGLCLTLAAIAVSPSGQPYPECQQTEAGGKGGTQDQPRKASDRPRLSGVPDLIERLINNDDPCHNYDNEKRDLAAQEAAATWGFWITILTLVQSVIATIGIIFVLRSLRQTDRSLREARRGNRIALIEGKRVRRESAEEAVYAEQARASARKTAVIEYRAWLNTSIRNVEIFYDGKGFKLSLDVYIRNVGRTVADSIRIYSIKVIGDFPDIHTLYNDFGKAREDKTILPYISLMPNDEFIRTLAFPNLETFTDWIDGSASLIVYIEISYRASVEGDQGRTEQAYLIGHRSNEPTLRDSLIFQKLIEKNEGELVVRLLATGNVD